MLIHSKQAVEKSLSLEQMKSEASENGNHSSCYVSVFFHIVMCLSLRDRREEGECQEEK